MKYSPVWEDQIREPELWEKHDEAVLELSEEIIKEFNLVIGGLQRKQLGGKVETFEGKYKVKLKIEKVEDKNHDSDN
jgi:hypothetical protein